MRKIFTCFFLSLLLLAKVTANEQYNFLIEAPAGERLQALWRYCFDHLISDKDSAATHLFFQGVANVADSLGDVELKRYSIYFRKCFRLLFSRDYKQYFAQGDYESPASVFKRAKVWALQNGYDDIAAACEHYTGEVYFSAARYGLAFEHLLKADEGFRKIGYEKVPAISIYLYDLGLDYYRFEEYDKSLHYFQQASRYPVYLPRVELSTLNSIGMIYGRKKEWDKAASFYRSTIEKAKAYQNDAWVGIASGSLGDVFLAKGQYNSALLYHQKNCYINTAGGAAPEDAARSALAIASIYIRQQQLDSSRYYISFGHQLATEYLRDPAERVEYRRRMLGVMVDLNKAKGDCKTALKFSDSLIVIKDSVHQMLDVKILNRAVEKAKAEQYRAELMLSESQKSVSRLRFFVLIAVLLCILTMATLLFNRYRVRKEREAQQAENERRLLALGKMNAEEKLKHAEELLTAYLTTIKAKTTLIEHLDTELQRLKETASHSTDLQCIAANREILVSGTILTDDDWAHFRGLFEKVYPGFLDRLRDKFLDLSPAEMRLLILTKLNLSTREMAHMLGVSVDAIRKSRYRLRKKLNLEEESNLEVLIQKI
ncbi:MAG TPA: hypothetical protein VKA92_08185 [Segetibacter sp.]|nr:hypothetical protein [Segetibacter sp.]